MIVPIYKTEAYLDRCIQSLADQTYENLEIILLDDGSPDNCPRICDRWAEADSRIRVVHKQNSGVSNTRNAGISLATGKYVTFVDSDDYLEAESIQVLVEYAEKYQLQCVAGGYKRLLRDGTLAERKSADHFVLCNNRQEIETHILRRLIGAECRGINPLSPSACVKLYDRQLIADHGVKFLSIREIGSEDFFFNICFFEHAQKVAVVPETLYVYRDNEKSCTNTYDPNRISSFIKLYQQMEQKNLLSDRTEYMQLLSGYILGGISVCMKLLVASQMQNKTEAFTEVLKNKEICRMLDDCSLRQIRFPLSLFCVMMKFRMRGALYLLISIFVKLELERK